MRAGWLGCLDVVDDDVEHELVSAWHTWNEVQRGDDGIGQVPGT